MIAAAAARRQRAGVVAHLTEPDLKNGRAASRDVQLVAALTLAHRGRSVATPWDLRPPMSWS